jgi:SAM-dependent methyltransferase
MAGLEAMLAPVDEPLIRALRLDRPCRIADVGCGGGGTTLEIMRRAPAGSAVHGYDIAPALIEAARARVPPGESGVDFTVADVAKTPAPQPHDRLASRFGVMFFDDPPAAFANLAGWLAPGGRFAFAVWGPGDENRWMTGARDAVAEVIEVPPLDPAVPNAFRYAEVDRLLDLLARAGLGEMEVRDWRGALAVGGGLPAAEAARFALAAFSVADLLAAADDRAREQAHRSLTERFARHQQDGVVRIDALVHIVTGARPGTPGPSPGAG